MKIIKTDLIHKEVELNTFGLWFDYVVDVVYHFFDSSILSLFIGLVFGVIVTQWYLLNNINSSDFVYTDFVYNLCQLYGKN